MLVIGHRGAPYYQPENTISSFRKAVEMGADMLEMDVHLCASGELVVIHDSTVERTTNGTGKISELKLSEIKELDAGSGEAIPTLEEVLKEFSGEVGFNIEMKGKGTAEPLWTLLRERIKSGVLSSDDLLISSLNPEEIFDFKSTSEGIRIGYIFEAHPQMGIEFALDVGAWAIHPRLDLIDENLMKRTKELGLEVIVWTVNDEVEMGWLMELGVEGMITDKPDVLAGMVKS